MVVAVMRPLMISHCGDDIMVGMSDRETPPTNQEAREFNWRDFI